MDEVSCRRAERVAEPHRRRCAVVGPFRFGRVPSPADWAGLAIQFSESFVGLGPAGATPRGDSGGASVAPTHPHGHAPVGRATDSTSARSGMLAACFPAVT